MITHIVFLKLKDRSLGAIEDTRDLILSLKAKVPTLAHLEAALDRHGDQAFATKKKLKLKTLREQLLRADLQNSLPKDVRIVLTDFTKPCIWFPKSP